MYYLLRHPRYLQQLRQEIDATFPADEGATINTAKLTGMKMLNAIMYALQFPPLPPLNTS